MRAVTGCNAFFRQLSLIASRRDLLEKPVTTCYKNKPVTEIKMEAALLVQKLSERGIKMKVADGELTCDSEQPIPKAIMTTIDAEKKQLVEYLGSSTPDDQQPVIPLAGPAERTPLLNKGTSEKSAEKRGYHASELQGTALPLTTEALPRPPLQLEALLRGAASGLLPKRGAVTLEAGLVTELNSYTLVWAASYLTGTGLRR